jgi:phosphatidylserine/phosphatidylglycerophosphate/cardiolipin synthase-like enzyme
VKPTQKPKKRITGETEIHLNPQYLNQREKMARAVPCIACNHPISEKHHIQPQAIYGSHNWNNRTVRLCANCHEIVHLILETWEGDRSNLLLKKIAPSLDGARIRILNETAQKTITTHLTNPYYEGRNRNNQKDRNLSPIGDPWMLGDDEKRDKV